MEFDENGRIYVVENPGYPLNIEGKVGRITLLEDTDGNGRPDKRTVFADKLTMPTGVMRWKKGVLVTDAPDVLYFEDTNGDGTINQNDLYVDQNGDGIINQDDLRGEHEPRMQQTVYRKVSGEARRAAHLPLSVDPPTRYPNRSGFGH